MCNKSFIRISIGSTLNIFSYVNENFKCIINVDINKINNQEVPFLNRFEKHIVTFENLLNNDLIDKSKEIENIINDLITFTENNKIFNYDFKNLLINCELEEIEGAIYNAYKKGYEDLKKEVILIISLILPQDVLSLF